MTARMPCASAARNAASRRRLEDRAVHARAVVVPAAANARKAAGASALGRRLVEAALEREDVALEPGQQVEPGAEAGVRELRQVGVEVDQPGQHDQRAEVDHGGAVRPSQAAAVAAHGPTATIRPAASTSSRPSGS